jgi:hypothetical protein
LPSAKAAGPSEREPSPRSWSSDVSSSERGVFHHGMLPDGRLLSTGAVEAPRKSHIGVVLHAGKHQPRLSRVQAAQLHDDEEQEDEHRETGARQVLPLLPQAHRAQGRKGLKQVSGVGFPESGFRSSLTPDPWNRVSAFRGVALIGRAAVSKTVGWGFESLHPCHRTEDEGEART